MGVKSVASECEDRGDHASHPTPHAPMTLGANQVSRVPESGWPIPLLVISGLATGPPAGVGDGLRLLSRRCQHFLSSLGASLAA